MSDTNPKAYPLATPELQQRILDLLQASARTGQVRKGANEATKALNKGHAELIVLAADTEPIEILLHLPLLCEDKNVPFVFVKSKLNLGRSCGVSRPVVGAAILARDNSPIEQEIISVRDAVAQLPL